MKATIYWIDGSWPGRLAILARPRGGEWLEEEVNSWRAEGISVVASLLENDEVAELELTEEEDYCKAQRIDFTAFPIPDRGAPISTKVTADFLRRLEKKLQQGKNVGLHCRLGVGRSAIIAAGLLTLGGTNIDEAFNLIRTARGSPVPDTPEQREWVVRFARDLLSGVSD